MGRDADLAELLGAFNGGQASVVTRYGRAGPWQEQTHP